MMPKKLHPKRSKMSYLKRTYMVPPAFIKVWKPVSEGNFQHFEHNRADPADFGISNDQDFEPPPQEVSDEVHIIDSVKEVLEEIRVLGGEKAAVSPIILVWEAFAKLWVIVGHEFASFVER